VERGLLRGVAVLRVVTYGLLVAVVAGQHAREVHPAVSWSLLCLAGAATVVLTWFAVIDPTFLVKPYVVVGELSIGAALLIADGAVFAHGHVGSAQGGLAGSWPVAGVLSAGIAFGPWLGLAAGAALGVAHAISVPLNGENFSELDAAHTLALVSSFVLYSLYGVASGYATRLAIRYDDVIANARARQEVARTLHDGVLQTLAVFARRTDDPELAALARVQDRELRAFIAADTDGRRPDARPRRRDGSWVEAGLRAAAARHLDPSTERTISVARDLPTLSPARADALIGAAGEALANAGKHAQAHHITVYVEPDGRGTFCSIKDDGRGFDPTAPSLGTGIQRSLRDRVAAVGRRCDVVAAPGHGTEVKLWL